MCVSLLNSLPLLSSTPFYKHTKMHLIPSFIDGYLGCYQFSTVYKTAMNVLKQVLPVDTCFYFSWIDN